MQKNLKILAIVAALLGGAAWAYNGPAFGCGCEDCDCPTPCPCEMN
ncbi:MAG: hypothetical protein AAF654_14910 [Myxococcota bacterium]